MKSSGLRLGTGGSEVKNHTYLEGAGNDSVVESVLSMREFLGSVLGTSVLKN